MVGRERLAPLWSLGLVAVALGAPFAIESSYWQGVMAAIAIWSIAAVSLAQAVNWMMRLSLMTPALMGLGAYAAAIAQVEHGWSFLPAAGIAALAAMVCAALVGLVAFRSSHWGFSIITFAANLILVNLSISLDDITHGPGGYAGIPPVQLFGRSLESGRSLYFLALAILAIQLCALWAWRRSVAGRSARIVGEDPQLAQALGIPCYSLQVCVFAALAAPVGIAGALYGSFRGVVSPELLGFTRIVDILAMVMIGGTKLLFGPILGAIAVTSLPEWLRFLGPSRDGVFGLVLILIVVLAAPRWRWRVSTLMGARS